MSRPVCAVLVASRVIAPLPVRGDHRADPAGELRRARRFAQLRRDIAGRIAARRSARAIVAAVVGFQARAQRTRRSELQARVDGRADGEAAIIERVFAVLRLHLAADFFDEVRSGDELIAGEAVRDRQIGGARFRRLAPR